MNNYKNHFTNVEMCLPNTEAGNISLGANHEKWCTPRLRLEQQLEKQKKKRQTTLVVVDFCFPLHTVHAIKYTPKAGESASNHK